MSCRAILCVCVGLALSTSGCFWNAPLLTGSGTLVTETHSAEDFDALAVESAYDVTARSGKEYAVEVTADDNVMEYVSVQQNGSQLKLGLSQPLRLQGVTLRAEITVPTLRSVDVGGASQVRINGIECSELELDLSGASQIQGQLFASDLHVDLSGASKVQLSGQCDHLAVDASGASSANLEELVSESSSIDASGASQVHIHTRGELIADVSGASKLTHNQEAEIGRVETSGASSMSQR